MTELNDPRVYLRRVLERYGGSSLASRLYLQIRVRNFPIDPMWPVLLSLSGQVISVGAGYGIFEMAAAMANPRAKFLATDLNQHRVSLGEAVSRDLPNIRFAMVDLTRGIPGVHADTFLLLDVLHHLEPSVQEEVLARIAEALGTSGRIVIKECGTKPNWKRWFNRLNDAIGSPFSSIYPRSEEDWALLLQRLGFSTTVVRLDRGSPYAHILIQGTKQSDSQAAI